MLRTSISPAVTVLRKLLTIILYSKTGLSGFCGFGESLFRAAIGRFLRIEGGLGGLDSFSITADLIYHKLKDETKYKTQRGNNK